MPLEFKCIPFEIWARDINVSVICIEMIIRAIELDNIPQQEGIQSEENKTNKETQNNINIKHLRAKTDQHCWPKFANVDQINPDI